MKPVIDGSGVSVELEIQLPMVPNFVRPVGANGVAIDVADLTDEQLRAIATRWTLALLAHAANRRRARRTEGKKW